MLTVRGYYDGEVIRPLEKIALGKNQQVTIAILDAAKEKPQMSEEERLRKIKS